MIGTPMSPAKAAIILWGKEAQWKMVVEECAELIVAIAKMGRASNGRSIEQVAEEIADVVLMMDQAIELVGPPLFWKYLSQKRERFHDKVHAGLKQREREEAAL